MLVSNLKNMGLSDKEARVYLAMLELGPSSVLEISARANINRPTTYVQIEGLKRLGLISSQTRGKKQLFQAESPENFQTIFEQEDSGLRQKRDELSRVMPDLKDLFHASGGRAKVRFIEGLEGISKVQAEFLKSGVREVIEICPLDDVMRTVPKKSQSFTPKRVAKKIFSKYMYTSSQGPILTGTDKQMYRQSKFIDPKKLPFHLDIAVYGKNVAIVSFQGKVSGVFIEHPEIADSFRKMLEFFWETL